MVVPAAVRRTLVEHAEAETPNEACGLVVLKDGVAERYVPGRNAAASPYRFELDVDPETWFLEDDGYQLAVFHSHVSSPPRGRGHVRVEDRELVAVVLAAVAHRRREHRALDRPSVSHLHGADR